MVSEVSAGDTAMAGDWAHREGCSLALLAPGLGMANAYSWPLPVTWAPHSMTDGVGGRTSQEPASRESQIEATKRHSPRSNTSLPLYFVGHSSHSPLMSMKGAMDATFPQEDFLNNLQPFLATFY